MVFQNSSFFVRLKFIFVTKLSFFSFTTNVESYRGWEGRESEKQMSVIGKRGKEFLPLPLSFLSGHSPPPTPPTKQNGLECSGEAVPLDLNSICSSSKS